MGNHQVEREVGRQVETANQAKAHKIVQNLWKQLQLLRKILFHTIQGQLEAMVAEMIQTMMMKMKDKSEIIELRRIINKEMVHQRIKVQTTHRLLIVRVKSKSSRNRFQLQTNTISL